MKKAKPIYVDVHAGNCDVNAAIRGFDSLRTVISGRMPGLKPQLLLGVLQDAMHAKVYGVNKESQNLLQANGRVALTTDTVTTRPIIMTSQQRARLVPCITHAVHAYNR